MTIKGSRYIYKIWKDEYSSSILKIPETTALFSMSLRFPIKKAIERRVQINITQVATEGKVKELTEYLGNNLFSMTLTKYLRGMKLVMLCTLKVGLIYERLDDIRCDFDTD